ncbi:MAG: hypothetical protein IH899_18805 [Planctomycetes bacterium]|nr:hypothetical protein [Planctomycetota bacterium]
MLFFWIARADAAERDRTTFPPSQVEFFEKEVRPVLASSCFECHGPQQQESGLRLDSRELILKGGEGGPVVQPGLPDKSRLIAAIRRRGELKMPPTGKLTPERVAVLETWIRMGLPWPEAKTVEQARSAADWQNHWAFRPVQLPGLPWLRTVNDCCGPRLALASTPGLTLHRPVWCPNIVEQQVPCTTYVPQVVRQQCPVQVCRYVPETVVEKIPVKICKWVREEVVEMVPVRTCRWVTETVTKQVPVRTCRIVCEERVRKVPVRTCKWVEEQRTCKVPYCVTKQVPYTVTQRVARCVAKKVPVTCTRMVAKCVPRLVAYEVCRLVPTTVCPTNSCFSPFSSGSCSVPAGVSSGAKTYESNKIVPIPGREADPNRNPESPQPKA